MMEAVLSRSPSCPGGCLVSCKPAEVGRCGGLARQVSLEVRVSNQDFLGARSAKLSWSGVVLYSPFNMPLEAAATRGRLTRCQILPSARHVVWNSHRDLHRTVTVIAGHPDKRTGEFGKFVYGPISSSDIRPSLSQEETISLPLRTFDDLHPAECYFTIEQKQTGDRDGGSMGPPPHHAP
jgi:hypothetical protein